jgi:hypothetical protein
MPQAKQAVPAKGKGFSDANKSWLKLKRSDVDPDAEEPKKKAGMHQQNGAAKGKSEQHWACTCRPC